MDTTEVEREEAELKKRFLLGIKILVGAIFALLLWCVLTAPARASPADDERGPRVRLALATEMLHGQGYWSPSVRVGYDGGIGVRVGAMVAPVWADRVPDKVKQERSEWDINSISFGEVDYELCAQRWCAGLGIARLSNTTYMNGTNWNFGVHARYAITANWSLVYDHYSHASKLGIAKDKSNRGWNLLGVAYAF